VGYLIILKQGAAIDEKTAAHKHEKVFFDYPSHFFSNISQNKKAKRLRFSPINLAKNFTHNPHFVLFLEPPAMTSAKSKTPKTISLRSRRLVKSSVSETNGKYFFLTKTLASPGGWGDNLPLWRP
jgi:hypothetical protein